MSNNVFSSHDSRRWMQRTLHFFAVVLILLPNFSVLAAPARAQAAEAAPERPEIGAPSSYQPVQFTRPDPRMGARPSESTVSTSEPPPTVTIECEEQYPGTWCPENPTITDTTWHAEFTSGGGGGGETDLTQVYLSVTSCDGQPCTEPFRLYHYIKAHVEFDLTYPGYTWEATSALFITPSIHTPYIPCGDGNAGSCNLALLAATDFTPIDFWYTVDMSGYIPHLGIPDTVRWEITVSTLPILPDGSTYCGDCSPYADSQLYVADPINTRTGGFHYPVQDLSIATSDGPVSFSHMYVSLATEKYTAPLGRGWTHNQDIRLVFPSDPMNEPGSSFVLFKDHSGNLYPFWDNQDGTYTPYAGLNASLIRNNGGVITYSLHDSAQNTYLFDANGRLQSITDPIGQMLLYSYDAGQRLSRVTASGDGRYLEFSYDADDRVSDVVDHTGRGVSFGYDALGNLVSSTDVLENIWTYEYADGNLLTRVIDPDGNTKVRNEYYVDAVKPGRVWKQFDGEDRLVVELTYQADDTTLATNALGEEQVSLYAPTGTLTGNQDGAGETVTKTYDMNFRPVSILDAGGHETQLTWSDDGAALTSMVDAEGNETAITYDALNNPVAVVDPLNHLTTYEYSGALLSSVTDALNGETTYTYTPEGYLESVTDARGQTTSYGYDSHGQRTSMTDALGHTWTYTYDELGRQIDATDPLGRVTHNEYDAAGRITRVTLNYDTGRPQNDENQYNIVAEYEYDVRGFQIAVTDTLGRTTGYEYDDAGRLIGTTDPAGNVTTNTYNQAGQLTAVTDALGRSTQYEYDAAGRLVSTIDALGNETSTAYNPDGTVASTNDALGRTTSFAYDSLKRVIAVTQPDGAVTGSNYDEAGSLVSTTDPLGNITAYEYDALGRLIRQIDPLGGLTEHFYDEAGNRIQTIDARGIATTFEYDELNRLSRVIDSLGNATSFEYDEAGRRTAVIDANEHRTTYTYDLLDRVVAATDPLDFTSRVAYDAAGQVAAQVDANGNSVEFEYDVLGRLLHQTDALNNTASFTYDAAGNRLTATDANGHTMTTVYDELHRPVAISDPLGNTTTTTYDAVGQVVAVQDANDSLITYSYDSLGRQLSVTDPEGNATHNAYDAGGRLVETTDANGVSTRYEYNALGQLTAVLENYRPGFQPTAEVNVRTEYTYDANGNRLSIADGNGHVTAFEYDELNRQLYEYDPLGNMWASGYDAVGNRTVTLDPNGTWIYYGYDERNQLVLVDYPEPQADVSLEYDPAGRRTSMVDGAGTTSWSYNAANRVTAITDPFNRTVSYEYDAAGNRTELAYPNEDTVAYAYDSANRLTGVTDWNDQTTQYAYDPVGRLLSVLRPNGVNTSYDYDGAGRLLALQHASGANSLSSFEYTYDPSGNRTRAVERISTDVELGPTVAINVTDALGTPLAGKTVYVFSNGAYMGYNQTTDQSGNVSITLPAGSYRFRVDVDGTQFWSGTTDHCTIGGCGSVIITIPLPVLVNVSDSDGVLRQGVPVYAFDNGAYTGYHATTDENGSVSLRLPVGTYRFRADFGGTQFWSGSQDHCAVSGCTVAALSVALPTTVTVLDNVAMPHAGVEVYAFDGTTYTGFHGTTDENGQVQMTLPYGDYRFRADFTPVPGAGATQFWSGTENHCGVPECREAVVNVTLPLVVTVLDSYGASQPDLSVYVFDGDTYTGFSGTTDANGQVSFSLMPGSYRFAADLNGTRFWSGTENHCTVPECSGAQITVSSAVTVTVEDTEGAPREGIQVYAFDGSSYTGFNAATDSAGRVLFTLPEGSYRFRADFNGTQFWSAGANHCDVPGCTSADVTVTTGVLVTVRDTDAAPKSGLRVYVFNGTTYTGANATTDADGQVVFTLPEGSYRFRADLNSVQFWSGGANHCDVPGCGSADITVTKPVTLLVHDTDGAPRSGLRVYVFNGSTYTGYNATTGADGQVVFTLPLGGYRFRADLNGTQFWSAGSNHCALPGCENAEVTVTIPITVTVQDGGGAPVSGVKVYAFNGSTYTGANVTTDANGQGVFTLQQGSYRFRADCSSVQYWSGSANHCDVPGCVTVAITVGPASTATPSPTAVPTATPTPTVSILVERVSVDNDEAEGNGTSAFPAISSDGRYVAFASLADNLVPGDTNALEDVFLRDRDLGTTILISPGLGGAPANGNSSVPYISPDGRYVGYTSGANNLVTGDDNGSTPDAFIYDRLTGEITLISQGMNGEDSDQQSIRPAVSPDGGYWTFASLASNLVPDDTNEAWDIFLYDQALDTLTRVSVDASGVQGNGLSSQPVVSETGRYVVYVSDADNLVSADTNGERDVFRYDTLTGAVERISVHSSQAEADGASNRPAVSADGRYIVFHSAAGNLVAGDTNGVTDIFLRDTVLGTTVRLSAGLGGAEADGASTYPAITTDGQFVQFSSSAGNLVTGDTNGVDDIFIVDLATGETRRLSVDGAGLQGNGNSNDRAMFAAGSPYLVYSSAANNLVPGDSNNAIDSFLVDWESVTGWETASVTDGTDAMATLPRFPRTFALVRSTGEGQVIVPAAQPRPQSDGPNDVTVTVTNTDGAPQAGLPVYVFDDATYIGFSGVTDAQGQALFTLPDGGYRFRADFDGTQFWSGAANHCAVPGCSAAGITVTKPVIVTVQSVYDLPLSGSVVYAFDETTYTGYSRTTDANGEASFVLPEGNYRFRTDSEGTPFWSGGTNHCAVPGCESAGITVMDFIYVDVRNAAGEPVPGVQVYAFDGDTYTGYTHTTDPEDGEAGFMLPAGSYRFRADLNGTQFWSGAENHCVSPDCTTVVITVTDPLTVTVQDLNGDPYPGLPVYAFDEAVYSGYYGTTDAEGQVTFTLPEGSYRFRADLDGVQFWSGLENHCSLPGCTAAAISLPGGTEVVTTVIDYTYDPLYRLTAADYSTGDYYHYAYDAVGNRLSQEAAVGSTLSTIAYQYDVANRLVNVNGVEYTWDAGGNLLNDGANTYTYDAANRLTSLVQGEDTYTYAYNGQGDRLQQSANGQTTTYTLDLNTGLTQVLDDGTHAYTYGLGRVAQLTDETQEYFLGDALGSVRQMTDPDGAVTFARAYDPYGVVTASAGSAASAYGYTGEYADPSGMVYLRARYYDVSVGRYAQKDPSRLEPNLYLYGLGNPIKYSDPSGLFSAGDIAWSMQRAPSLEWLMEYYARNIAPPAMPEDDKWGFFSALLDAEVGDTLRIGGPVLMALNPSVRYGREEPLWMQPDCTIMVGSRTLTDYFYQITLLPTWRDLPAQYWRDTSASFYLLNSPSMTAMYVDGVFSTDLPDYHSVDIAYCPALLNKWPGGCSISQVLDRFGNQYLVVEGSIDQSTIAKLLTELDMRVRLSFPIGLTYSEGYVCPPGSSIHSCQNRSEASLANEAFLSDTIRGACTSAGITAALGAKLVTCLNGNQSLIYTWGFAASIGSSGTFGIPLNPLPGLEWDSVVQARFAGVTYVDLMIRILSSK